jgi:hypothetical protein
VRWALAAALLVAARASAEPISGPRLDYVLQCMGCHREDGRGAADRVPALAGEVGRFLGVAGGRAYLVRVPGVAHAPIDDAAVAALVNWMLRTFDPARAGTDFTPYTAEEVTRLRRVPLLDAAAARRALTAALDAARAPPTAAARAAPER